MKNDTALHAIRLKCLDCSCGSYNEVTECPIKDCPLYIWRSGHNPFDKGKRTGRTKEQMEEIRSKKSK